MKNNNENIRFFSYFNQKLVKHYELYICAVIICLLLPRRKYAEVALGPIQPPIQWVPGGSSPGGKAASE